VTFTANKIVEVTAKEIEQQRKLTTTKETDKFNAGYLPATSADAPAPVAK